MTCNFLATANGQRFSGDSVLNSNWAIVVKYHGPTNYKCSRWIATLKYGAETATRATVSFSQGPLAAAAAIVNRQGRNWQLLHCCTVDSETYVISVG